MAYSNSIKLTMSSSEEIGKAIQKQRRAQKITQKEFAQRLGKSERTIQKYESGEILLKIDVLKQIANELNVPWQELLFAKDTNTPKDNTTAEYPAYEFHTMSDVINALFAITELTDFSFELTNTKPPENPEWTAGIKVNGKGNGKYDADFCLFMENWKAKKNMLQTGKISKEKFDSWNQICWHIIRIPDWIMKPIKKLNNCRLTPLVKKKLRHTPSRKRNNRSYVSD